MFAHLQCRFFGHRWTETHHGTRLRCLTCSTVRAGYAPKENHAQ